MVEVYSEPCIKMPDREGAGRVAFKGDKVWLNFYFP